MSYYVIASNVPKSVTSDKVKEFLSFSGKVESIDVVSVEAETVTYKVKFAAKEALSSALLLNGAELDGKSIVIKEEGASDSSATTNQEKAFVSSIHPESSAVSAAASVPLTESGKAAQAAQADSDIDQESKPKTTIIAEYLAHGYVLGDQAVEKAIDLDKQHGISDRFKNFLTSLDSKYHVQEKAAETNSKYGIDKKIVKGRDDLGSYFEKASQTSAGAKIHNFYTGLVNSSIQIHDEARRLANLEEAKAQEKK